MLKKNHFAKSMAKTLSPEDYFEIITDWEFAAALCLFDIKNFHFSVSQLSSSLGLSAKRSNEIYAKLFQHGLVKIVGQKVERADKHLETTDDILSMALQIAHTNELNLAISKLKSVDVVEREFTSLTFAGKSKDIKKIKLWIRSKRQEFERIFESPKADQIFLFSMQLFPLSDKVTK